LVFLWSVYRPERCRMAARAFRRAPPPQAGLTFALLRRKRAARAL